MPWCEPCARYLTPTAVKADGTCPHCGKDIDAAKPINETVSLKSLATDGSVEKAPWHFKLMLTALTLYLGWRVVSIFI